MNIGLVDVDSHNFPNLALMKISSYHKARGDRVEWWNGLKHYDVVYKSKVFDDTYTQDMDYCINADEIIKGGTGYDLVNRLPDIVEHQYPDYTLYDIDKKAYGFLTRGCPRGCPFCIVKEKEGKTHTVAEIGEFWNGQSEIVLLDANILAGRDRERHLNELAETGALIEFNQGLDIRLVDRDITTMLNKLRFKDIHFAWDNPVDDLSDCFETYKRYATNRPHGTFGMVYVLANYNSTTEQDLYRIYQLRDYGYDPFVMIYDKPNAPNITRQIARWCNNKWIFKQCERFEDYRKTKA